jgi:hypothetical protein
MADGEEPFCNVVCRRVFPVPPIYNDRPLLRNGCYRTLPMWEATRMAKYDMQGVGVWEGGKLND